MNATVCPEALEFHPTQPIGPVRVAVGDWVSVSVGVLMGIDRPSARRFSIVAYWCSSIGARTIASVDCAASPTAVVMRPRCVIVCLALAQTAAAAAATAAATAAAPAERFDVLVVGANAAGVAAAVTASDGNRFTVKVVEPLEMIGGMAAAGGVALMNQGGCGLTGLSRNWSMLCGEVSHAQQHQLA